MSKPPDKKGWDELKEHVDDRQPSGGYMKRYVNYPFYVAVLDVRDESGKVIGQLIVNELIPLKSTPMCERSYRVGLKEGPIIHKPDAIVRWMTGADEPFPDEEE